MIPITEEEILARISQFSWQEKKNPIKTPKLILIWNDKFSNVDFSNLQLFFSFPFFFILFKAQHSHCDYEGSVRGAVWVMSWESKRTESLGWYHCNSALFLMQQLPQQIGNMKSRGRSITNCKFPVGTFLNSSVDIKSQNHVRKLSAKKKKKGGGGTLERWKELDQNESSGMLYFPSD